MPIIDPSRLTARPVLDPSRFTTASGAAAPPSGPGGFFEAGAGYASGVGKSFQDILRFIGALPGLVNRDEPLRTPEGTTFPHQTAALRPPGVTAGIEQLALDWIFGSVDEARRQAGKATAPDKNIGQRIGHGLAAVAAPVGGGHMADLGEKFHAAREAGQAGPAGEAVGEGVTNALLTLLGGKWKKGQAPAGPLDDVLGMIGEQAPKGGKAAAELAATRPVRGPAGQVLPGRTPPSASLASLDDLEIPKLPGEATGSKSMKVLERTMEASFGGAKHFQKFRAEQAVAVKKYAMRVSDVIVKRATKTGHEVGAALQRDWQKARQLVGEAAETAFEPILGQVGTKNINLAGTSTKATARGIAKTLSDITKWVAPEGVNEVKRLASKLGRAGDKIPTNPAVAPVVAGPAKKYSRTISVQALHETRNSIERAIVAAEEAGEISLANSARKTLLPELDKLMETGLHKLGPDLAEAYKSARAVANQNMKAFNDRTLRELVKSAPETLHHRMGQLSVEDIGLVRRMATPGAIQDMKRRWWADTIRSSLRGPKASIDRVAAAMGGSQVNAEAVGTALRKLGPERINAWFSPKERGAMTKFVGEVNKLEQPSWKNVSSMMANSVMIYAAGKAITFMDPTAAIRGAGWYYGTNVIGRVLTSPRGLDVTANMIRASKYGKDMTVNNGAFMYWSGQLNRIMQEAARQERSTPLSSAEEEGSE